MTFLSAQDIRKSFGPVEVLHGVDFSVDAGSVVALLGENGAGKSTLVRILAGDHHPDTGTIRIEGEDVRFHGVGDSRALGIRLIAQELADAPTLTVAENVALGAWPVSGGIVSRRRMRAKAKEVLSELGLDIDVDRRVSTLRLGERQIVEIARAVAGSSRCLIFDEPTAALSDVEARRLFDLFAGSKAKASQSSTSRTDWTRSSLLQTGSASYATVASLWMLPSGSSNTQAVVTAMVGRAVEAIRHAPNDTRAKTGKPVTHR